MPIRLPLYCTWKENRQNKEPTSLSTNTGLKYKILIWNLDFTAILDKNSDGKISQEELTPLALWFDENKNAISEVGEVKRLEEVGVISLFYKPTV